MRSQTTQNETSSYWSGLLYTEKGPLKKHRRLPLGLAYATYICERASARSKRHSPVTALRATFMRSNSPAKRTSIFLYVASHFHGGRYSRTLMRFAPDIETRSITTHDIDSSHQPRKHTRCAAVDTDVIDGGFGQLRQRRPSSTVIGVFDDHRTPCRSYWRTRTLLKSTY